MSAPALSLYEIDSKLLELFERQAETQDAEQPHPDIDEEINEYLKAHVRKVDGIVWFIRFCEVAVETCKAESKRYAEKAERWERRVEQVKNGVLWALKVLGLPYAQSSLNKLRPQRNPPSVDVQYRSQVPNEYLMVEVRMTLKEWNRLTFDANAVGRVTGEIEPAKSRILSQLKAGVEIPGCRIAEDRHHLRID